MKISVIIPVYNVEAYLERCLLSVLTQDITPHSLEVIAIIDGATDQSGAIVASFAEKYTSLKVITQENSGVSVARNKGLAQATGAIVTFVDSDDYLERNALLSVVDYFIQNDLDVLYAHIQAVNEQYQKVDLDYKVGIEGVVANGFQHQRRTFPPTFYRRALIGDIHFTPGITVGEDTVFNAKVHALAQRCSYFDQPYYNYLLRANSATKTIRSEKAFCGFLLAIEELQAFKMEFFSSHQEAKTYFDQQIALFLDRIAFNHLLPNLNKNYFDTTVHLCQKYNLQYLLKDLSSKYKGLDQGYTTFKRIQQYYRLRQRFISMAWRCKQFFFAKKS